MLALSIRLNHWLPFIPLSRAIFNRWIQDNDFNYTGKPMGMKQIASYQSIGTERQID